MGAAKALWACLGLLDRADRVKLLTVAAVQVFTGVLDLVGVLLLGLVAALAVTLLQQGSLPPYVASVNEALDLDGLDPTETVGLIALVAALLLLLKSVVSSFLLRYAFSFLAGRQAAVSARLGRQLLSQPLTFIQERSSQKTSYALVQGAGVATMIVLGQGLIVVSEGSLLVILTVALLFVNPIVALTTAIFFGLVALLLQLLLGNKADRAGRSLAELDLDSFARLQEVLGGYREVIVLSRREHYITALERLRAQAATLSASIQFAGSVPKYVFEVALVAGGAALSVVLLLTQDYAAAAGTLAVFLVASTRLLPSIARLQSAFLTLRNASGLATPTLEIAHALSTATPTSLRRSGVVSNGGDLERFPVSIRVRNLSFAYSPLGPDAVSGVSLDVNAGSSLAVIGKSGAGKSTLADLILGLIEPQSGTVEFNGLPPREALDRWPGLIAYVPQVPVTTNGTVRANVALGLPTESIEDDLVWSALERAQLADFVRTLPKGLDSLVGEHGSKLSGGQRQRLGVARALYSQPRVLILDEATSALDVDTEAALGATLHQLEAQSAITSIVIAHRLSTVRTADQVLFLDQGFILASGTFDEVRARVPDLDRQARLSGIA